MTRLQKKKLFVSALADYLSRDLGRKSIELQLGKDSAKDWALLWSAAGLFGYPSTEEVRAHLEEMLG